MRVTIKELRRIIKEEYAKVLEEDITTGELDDPKVLEVLSDVASALALKDRELPVRLTEIIDHNLRTPITIGINKGDKGSYIRGFDVAKNNLRVIQDALLGVTPQERKELDAWLAAQEAEAPAPSPDPSFAEEETP
tara:strand:+ start:82 stop:489 length:408 start_codon:yes stop_codon:yes gene_type:complete